MGNVDEADVFFDPAVAENTVGNNNDFTAGSFSDNISISRQAIIRSDHPYISAGTWSVLL